LSEPVPSTDQGVQKRRSTRIVHAVPLSVTGVDALGQPFKERTSTLIISCHGCKYQSKHYVPKNSYVTLEIPNPDSAEPARTSQARVTWVQRPRTVRELFQVGVELEVPGNIWGVSFPPDDWFPYVEPVRSEIPAPGVMAEEPGFPAASAGPASSAPAVPVPPAIPAPVFAAEEKTRVVPFPVANEISAMMARQMARLLVEAKQQLQSAVHDAAAAAAEVETRQLVEQLHAQLEAAAQKAIEAAAAAQAGEGAQRARVEIDAAAKASTNALREEWTREAERGVRNWNQHMAAQLAETGESLRNKLVSRIESELNNTGATTRTAWQQQLSSDIERARTDVNELAGTARKLSEEIGATTGQAREGWRRQAESDLGAAQRQWHEQIQSSLADGAAQLSAQLAQLTKNAAAGADHELAARAVALRKASEKVMEESRQSLAALRSGLDQELSRAHDAVAKIEEGIKRSEGYSERLEAASRAATEEVNHRFEILLAAQGEEMNRRADQFVAGIAQRLQPSLEAATQQAMGAFRTQVDQVWKPLLASAGQSLEQMRAGQQQLEHTLATLRDRLHEASQQVANEAATRMQERVAQLRKDFEQAGQIALGRFQEELENKGTEATHTTFEALFKASDWYQKKAQTSMQTALEKALEQSNVSLREKAAEVSRLFASELDHYSRSYVDHTRGQLEESVKESLERGRGLLSQTSQTTAATFADEVHHIAGESAEEFSQAARHAVEEATSQMATRAGQVRGAINAHAHQAFAEFEGRVGERVDQGVAQARHRTDAQLTSLLESWRARYDAEQKQWLERLAQLTGDAVEHYKGRLENASNSWLVASVTTLSQHSQTVIESLAQAAEVRLQQTCSEVFAGLADSLRTRLLGISSDMRKDVPPPERK
jgi:hypothetical protein